MDAHIDVFEDRVQKRIAKVQPSDLLAKHEEIANLSAEMIASLVMP